MRFPWLQVDADFIAAHAGDLGALLGISRREAMGLVLDLWTWALARAPDDREPDGFIAGIGPVPDRLLSGSVGWGGPVEQLSAALRDVGLLVVEDGGYRLTGFERYKATWDKNRRRTARKPEGNRTGTGAEPVRKTQTQIKTQKKEEDLPLPPQGGVGTQEKPSAPPSTVHDAAGRLPFEVPEAGPSGWTIQDACDAVHRVVMGPGNPYTWDMRHDEAAAAALMSLCAADKVPMSQVPEEIGRRFGRALVRAKDRFATGKAQTLRQLAVRECWRINATCPEVEREDRGEDGVARRRRFPVEPWVDVLADREAA